MILNMPNTKRVKPEYINQNCEAYYDAITLSSIQPLRAKAALLQGQKVTSNETE